MAKQLIVLLFTLNMVALALGAATVRPSKEADEELVKELVEGSGSNVDVSDEDSPAGMEVRIKQLERYINDTRNECKKWETDGVLDEAQSESDEINDLLLELAANDLASELEELGQLRALVEGKSDAESIRQSKLNVLLKFQEDESCSINKTQLCLVISEKVAKLE